MAGIMGRRKRRAAVALHVPELTHAVKRVAGSNRRPCPPFTVGNRPIPIRQRYMRQPRAISMVRCGVFSAYKARSRHHTFQSRSATIRIGTFCHPASVDEESYKVEPRLVKPSSSRWCPLDALRSFRDASPEAARGRSWGPFVKPGCCGTNPASIKVLVSS